ncbi:hypothetical protein MKY04_03235 [Lysinibacillus telephonicus]
MTFERGIYIITGIMASGKSTIAQMLAEQFEKVFTCVEIFSEK